MRLNPYCGFGLIIILSAGILNASCSQPVLESADCTLARDSVKRLYSVHLDQGPNPDREKLEPLRPYISGELFEKLASNSEKGTDYLTQFNDFPKAFRVGTCRDTETGPEFEVLLFWRRNDQNFEEKIIVSTVKEENWVTEKVRRGTK